MKQGISLPQIPKKLLDTNKELYDYLFGLQQALLAKQTDDYGAVDKASSDIASFITNNKASQAEAIAGTLDTKIITPHTLREGLNASGDAPIYACRAWGNFSQAGVVNASGNISSIVDGGTGYTVVNFTTAMPDANYAILLTCKNTDSTEETTDISGVTYRTTPSTTSFEIVNSWNNVLTDVQRMYIAIFR